MKTLILAVSALAVLLPAFPRAFAAPNTFDGTITDAMCSRKHMMPGKTDAECIKACVKEGSAYVLVSGDKTYTLTAKAQMLEAFAGKHVVVHGAANGSKITVSSVEEAPATK